MIRIFGHYFSLRAILIATFELAALVAIYNLAAMVTTAVVFGDSDQELYGQSSVLLVFSVLFWLIAIACGMYSAKTVSDTRQLVGRILAVAVIAYFLMEVSVSVMEIVLENTLNLKLYYAINLVVAICYVGVSVLFRLQVFSRRLQGTYLEHRVAVLGTGELAGKVAGLEAVASGPYTVSTFIPVAGGEEEKTTVGADARIPQGKIKDNVSNLLDFAREQSINEVVFASRERRGMPTDALMACKLGGVIVSNFPDFWERQAGQLDLDSLNPSTMIFSSGLNLSWQGEILKRTFDIVIGTLLLIFTLPICIIVAICIKLESPGPLFYLQQRVGQYGKTFWIIKFRSMAQNAEKDGQAVWAQKNDSRVTRIGKFIRRSRIDEIPQVINVLAGDMSFVGPRPERPVFVDELSKKIRFYDIRHQLKPGITGWAQVNLPYGASDEDAKAKLAYDLYYVKNWNLFLDVVILVQTVQVVIWQMGGR